MLRSVGVAIHVAVLSAAVAVAVQQGDLGIEPPNEDLLAGHAFLCDYLEKGYGVAVGTLEHLADDAQQVPHALGFTTTQRPQQRRPFGRSWWRRRA